MSNDKQAYGSDNLTTGQNDANKDVQEEIDEEGMKIWLRKLKNDDALKPLIKKLFEAKLLKDFFTLMEVISTGELEAESLPLVS